MIKNWYALTIDELVDRKTKLLDWVMENSKHEKAKKSWQAIVEITEVVETKKQAESDPFLQDVINYLF